MTPNPQDSAVALEVELLPCPFCGHEAPYFERTGTSGHSCIVVCGYCGARHESSDEYERSGSSWNTRASQSDGTAGWQPIASAPKDGVLSLFCNMKAEQLRETFFVDWMVKGEFCGDRRHRATHWMALPAAPNQGENHGE